MPQHPPRFAALTPVLVSLFLAACAGSQEQPESVKPRPKAAAVVKAAPGHVLRADVDRALGQGPPWLLRRVVPEEVLRDGVFVGWRLVALTDEWSGVDLKPGDIVTRVNGRTLEREGDLWAAWVAVAGASEIRVSYERDGAARELVIPIDGAPTQLAASLREGRIPGRPAGRPRGTIVIEEDPGATGSGE